MASCWPVDSLSKAMEKNACLDDDGYDSYMNYDKGIYMGCNMV